MTVVAADTFTRTTSGTADLGTADTGGAWTATRQGSSTFLCDGSRATITCLATGNTQRAVLDGVSQLDSDTTVTIRTSAIDRQWEFLLGARSTGLDTDGLFAHVLITTAEVVRGNFIKRVASTQSIVTGSAVTDVSGAPAWAANTDWNLRFRIVQGAGSNKDLKMKVWRAADAEPSTWAFEVTTTEGTDSAGGPNIRGLGGASSETLQWDNLVARDLSVSLTATDAVQNATATPTRALTLARAITDAVANATAAPTRLLALGRSITDAGSLSDAAVMDILEGSIQRTTDDAVHFSEAIPKIGIVSDSVNLSDSLTRSLTMLRSISDAVSLADVATGPVLKARTATDAVDLDDAVTRALTLNRLTFEGLYDDFNRDVPQGWGTTNFGAVWTWADNEGFGYSSTTTSGQKAFIVASDSTTVRLAYLDQQYALDQDVTVRWTSDKLPSGATQQPRVLPRIVSFLPDQPELLQDNYYRLRVDWQTSLQIRLVWEKCEDGVVSTLATSTDLFAKTDFEEQDLYIRARASGSDLTQLDGKVWFAGQPEPDWQLEWEDGTQSLQEPGTIGLQFRTAAGTSNWPVTAAFQEFSVGGGLVFTDEVDRGGGSYPRVTADPVELSAPADVAIRLITVARGTTDSATLSDATLRAIVLARVGTDAVNLAQAVSRPLTLFRSAGHLLDVFDQIADVRTIGRSSTDAADLDDAALRAMVTNRTVTDALIFVDASIRTMLIFKTVSDTLGVSDALSLIHFLVRQAVDTLHITDLGSGDVSGPIGEIAFSLLAHGVGFTAVGHGGAFSVETNEVTID
jgi:hypothetical protein